MPSKKKIPTLQLGEETWGERVNRAYRRGREVHGFTYRDIVKRVSQFMPTSDAAVISLNTLTEPPTATRKQMVAFYVILAYGFEPNDFDLNASTIGIDKEVEKRARDVLSPSSACLTDIAA